MLRLRRVLVLAVLCVIAATIPAAGQQRGSVSGRILDAGGLVLPGATVTVTEQNTGFTRTVVAAETGAYAVPNLDPGVYVVVVEMPGFATVRQPDAALTAGSALTLDFRLQVAGVAESVTVTAESPLVETSTNQIGGSLSSQEIEEIPSNFRNFTALTQLIPGITPNPAASTFEGGQVVANGTPSQQNVYLIDGLYNNDDRLGGSQGTQVRVVLDNIAEYQVLTNQYSSQYGGGAGTIINMITRGGTNELHGRVYSYFRDDRFNARNAFLPASAPKPQERTLQAGFGVGGPIVRNRAHFYFTMEKDHEDIAGQKRFPAAAAPLARDMVGTFEVRATNYFGRGDLQLNQSNILSFRWVLETAPTRGEGFNTNNETIDAQGWESDKDHFMGGSYTSVWSSRATNEVRVGWIGEELGTGAQALFTDDVKQVGFDGRDPFSIGQRNTHPSYVTGRGGEGLNTRIRTYVFDETFSYFAPSLWGREHTFKAGGGLGLHEMPPRTTFSTGTFNFTTDAPYNPANPATFPNQFTVTVGPPDPYGYPVFSRDRRFNFFAEDRIRVSDTVTLNLGVRYDHHRQTPDSKDDVAPRVGFAWDLRGTGRTVVRGGIGKFYAYPPVVLDLTLQQNNIRTRFPTIEVNAAHPLAGVILRPDMISDSEGNPGVAHLSPAGQAALNQLRDQVLAGATFNPNPWVDSDGRQLPYTWSWSVGMNHQIGTNAAIGADYVANVSRDQMGIIDINEPVNGVRPGPAVFDPTGALIPLEARGTTFRRVLQVQTSPLFDGDYNSLQLSFLRRMANRWSGRLAYTFQKSNYVGTNAGGTGIGNPDARRVWLDDDPRADYGRFGGDRTHVLAASSTVNVWQNFNVAAVVSAISGAPINEIVGRDVNGDLDSSDRPIRGRDDLTLPIRSEVDGQGRAVVNGLDGPGSFLVDMSFRYAIPLSRRLESIDLFYDIFNLLNRENHVPPTGNRASANFMIPTAAQFPRQMQFGVRVRF
jgi:hypothetical protein